MQVQDIQNNIMLKLQEIEKENGVKIILAVESGSRAWKMTSRDSDFDVRFIYVRPEKDYLRLDNIKDIIDWQLDEVYDINGWDVKKFLQHLFKSNAVVFEWLSSNYAIFSTWIRNSNLKCCCPLM
ncbi:DNA polymerase beta superfamily protein [Anaerovibrio sp. RM50]|uniref:DNA polymerase beta superfamily protein n=1 Tax=Anaerovibrio sp. RM50 TaxID=1200557 RepID=UPI000687B55B|nr:nucleotidyltransferase domain-containing protein [Anaerovibrio sp. RM50]